MTRERAHLLTIEFKRKTIAMGQIGDWLALGRPKLRGYGADDAAGCWNVLYHAVHEGTHGAYDARERAAWAPSATAPADWGTQLSRQYTLVAVWRGRIVGFMAMQSDGYLDYAYVAPRFIGRGLAGRLYDAVLSQADLKDADRLSSEASHLARPFLEKRGWHVVARQSVIRRGVALTNFRMERDWPQQDEG